MKLASYINLLPVAAASLLYCTGCEREEHRVELSQAKVETAPVAVHRFQRRVLVQGTVSPVDDIQIAARTSGNIDRLAVSEGDAVTAGQLLFEVDRRNLENQVALAEQELAVARDNVDTAKADLEIARANLAKAELDFKRSSSLIESQAISMDAYETSDVKIKTAQAEAGKAETIVKYSESKVKQAEASLEIARKNLDDSRSRAPFDGVVSEKYKDPNEFVSEGTVILRLENQCQQEVCAFISAIYYPLVVKGETRARVFSDERLVTEAVVSYRAANVEPLSRTFEIKVLLPENTPLISGTLCDLELILEEREGAGLPDDAVLLRKGGDNQIYVVEDGKVAAVAVETGLSCDGYTELVLPDEYRDAACIVKGQYFVSPGDRVTVIDSKIGEAGR